MEHLWSYLCRVIDEVSKCNIPLKTKEDRALRSKAELSVLTPFFKAAFRRASSLKSTEIMFVGHLFDFCFLSTLKLQAKFASRKLTFMR